MESIPHTVLLQGHTRYAGLAEKFMTVSVTQTDVIRRCKSRRRIRSTTKKRIVLHRYFLIKHYAVAGEKTTDCLQDDNVGLPTPHT